MPCHIATWIYNVLINVKGSRHRSHLLMSDMPLTDRERGVGLVQIIVEKYGGKTGESFMFQIECIREVVVMIKDLIDLETQDLTPS